MRRLVNNKRFKLKTPHGYNHFNSLAITNHKSFIEIQLKNGIINCSESHKFWQNDDWVNAGNLDNTYISNHKISNIRKYEYNKLLFDIVEVKNPDNSFLLHNSIKTHNCQFLTFEKSLIDTNILDFYEIEPPIKTINDFEIYKEELSHPDSLIVITIDPSGGGDDNSVMQLWEISPKKVYQLASIANNSLDASQIFEKILWLQIFLKTQWNYLPDESLIIFERNGIGEGVSQILTQTEKAIEELEIPIFHDNKGPGLHMNPTSKQKLALQFKNLIEYEKLIVNDMEMIEELYGFIRHKNGSYSAKSGYKDDRIMAAFQIVYYLMNIFADFAQGDFSVDNMMIVKPEEKKFIEQKDEVNPADLHKKRVEKEKQRQLEALALQGSSIIVNDNEDDIDLENYDIISGVF